MDVYSFGANYADLASLGALPKYTCGSLYYYPGFNAARDAAKLEAELTHNLTRETGGFLFVYCVVGLIWGEAGGNVGGHMGVCVCVSFPNTFPSPDSRLLSPTKSPPLISQPKPPLSYFHKNKLPSLFSPSKIPQQVGRQSCVFAAARGCA